MATIEVYATYFPLHAGSSRRTCDSAYRMHTIGHCSYAARCGDIFFIEGCDDAHVIHRTCDGTDDIR